MVQYKSSYLPHQLSSQLILAFLRENNSATKIRLITDLTRYEDTGSGLARNDHAGEDIIVFIRSLGLDQIPMLVFSSNIQLTEFVKDHALTGSTTWYKVLLSFINGLAGSKNDVWAHFNAVPEETKP